MSGISYLLDPVDLPCGGVINPLVQTKQLQVLQYRVLQVSKAVPRHVMSHRRAEKRKKSFLNPVSLLEQSSRT